MDRTVFILFACLSPLFLAAEGGVGVGWGRQTSQKLLPSTIVDTMLADGVQRVKLFSLNSGVTDAFAYSDIDVMVTLPNQEIIVDAATRAMYQRRNMTKAQDWISQNITDIIESGIRITHLLVGNEAIENTTYHNTVVVEQFKELQDAIDKDERLTKWNKKLTITIPHWTEVLKPGIELPSQADFRPDIKDKVLEYLEVQQKHDGPFMVNLYPLWDLRQKQYPLEFGFFDGNGSFHIKDGNVVYTNVFDLIFDTFFWALKNNGYEKLKMVVGQVGWPTDGDSYANIPNAKRFYDGLLNRTANNVGTPMYPGPIETFLHSFVDENNLKLHPRGPTDRHYGIYNYDGTPKFGIDFTLKGRKDFKLEPAQGIDKMPRRWCVFNDSARGNVKDEEIMQYVAKACSKADCSRMNYGGSCSNLDFNGNVSHAFNQYYQWSNQKKDYCSWNGLGAVVGDDPSTKECAFRVQILSTIFLEGVRSEMAKTLASNARETLKVQDFGLMVVLLLFSVGVVLFWL